MPDDLLPHVLGPTPYSTTWLWLAVLFTVALITWYTGVLVWTMPDRRLRNAPVIGAMRDRMVRHRYVKAVRAIGDRYRAGELDAASACADMSRVLREFLHHATGMRAEYMQLDDIAASALAPTAPLFADLGDAQFNDASQVDVGRASVDVEELIRSWT